MTSDEIRGRAFLIAHRHAVATNHARALRDEILAIVTAALEGAAKIIDSKAGNIRGHAMYPAYGLNSQVQAFADAAEIVRALIPATRNEKGEE